MLKRIPSIVSPELLQALASMGHNDRLVLGDANFPAASTAGSHTLVRADGHKMTDLLRAITTLLPVEGSVWRKITSLDNNKTNVTIFHIK